MSAPVDDKHLRVEGQQADSDIPGLEGRPEGNAALDSAPEPEVMSAQEQTNGNNDSNERASLENTVALDSSDTDDFDYYNSTPKQVPHASTEKVLAPAPEDEEPCNNTPNSNATNGETQADPGVEPRTMKDVAGKAKKPKKKLVPSMDRPWSIATFLSGTNREEMDKLLQQFGHNPKSAKFKHLTNPQLAKILGDKQRRYKAHKEQVEQAEAEPPGYKTATTHLKMVVEIARTEMLVRRDFIEETYSRHLNALDDEERKIAKETLFTHFPSIVLDKDFAKPAISFKAQIDVRRIITARHGLRQMRNNGTAEDTISNLERYVSEAWDRLRVHVSRMIMVEDENVKLEAAGRILNKVLGNE